MHHSPHAKGRLLLPNSPALLTPWPPKPPALKCFLAPSPAAWPVGGGPPGGTTMMPEHPQCHGEPHSCPCPWGAPGLPPKACRSDGSAQTCRLGQGLLPPPHLHPCGPTAPVGGWCRWEPSAGAAPSSGSVLSAQGPGEGGGPVALSGSSFGCWQLGRAGGGPRSISLPAAICRSIIAGSTAGTSARWAGAGGEGPGGFGAAGSGDRHIRRGLS